MQSYLPMMKAMVALAATLLLVPLARADEDALMRAQNQHFRAHEAARPESETSYTNTKVYKAAKPEQRRQADQDIAKMNKILDEGKPLLRCMASHADDPYRAAHCDMKGNYKP
jgi:hypothetical protein